MLEHTKRQVKVSFLSRNSFTFPYVALQFALCFQRFRGSEVRYKKVPPPTLLNQIKLRWPKKQECQRFSFIFFIQFDGWIL